MGVRDTDSDAGVGGGPAVVRTACQTLFLVMGPLGPSVSLFKDDTIAQDGFVAQVTM